MKIAIGAVAFPRHAYWLNPTAAMSCCFPRTPCLSVLCCSPAMYEGIVMLPPNVILIVDDTIVHRRFLRLAVLSYLDPRDWEVIEADCLDGGLQLAQDNITRLAMALVDASL